jgi:hypothetical protein
MQIGDCRLLIGRLGDLGRAAAVIAAVLCSSAVTVSESAAQDVQSQADAPAQEESGGGFAAKVQDWAKKHQIVERLNGEIDGWYPRIGGMTRGGGFALGPGYRFHPMGGPVLVDVSAGMSFKLYKSVDANIRWYRSANEKFEFWTDYRWEDFPQEDYFGPGFDTSLDGRTSYKFGSHDFQARAQARPLTWLTLGADIGYMTVDIGAGSDSNFPSIEALFTDLDAPGLLDQPNYLHTTIFAESDDRDYKGNPGSGGFYRLSYGLWDDRDGGLYDFGRLDFNANQWVPLTASKKHVAYGRLGLSFTNNDPGARVPFYFLPYVGGVDTIRSFREFRFKDENALWIGGEYQFRPIEYVSLALFADAGKVAHDWEDIDFRGMKSGYGFGVRFGTQKQQFGRIDVGFGGGEGTRVFLKFGTSL